MVHWINLKPGCIQIGRGTHLAVKPLKSKLRLSRINPNRISRREGGGVLGARRRESSYRRGRSSQNKIAYAGSESKNSD